MFIVLKGASGGEKVQYEVILKWFTECKIIDGRLFSKDHIQSSYERLALTTQSLGRVQFMQLIGILKRDTRQNLIVFYRRFNRETESLKKSNGVLILLRALNKGVVELPELKLKPELQPKEQF